MLKLKQTLLPAIAIAVGLGIVITLGALEASSSPQFCGSCHEMKAYVVGWEESAHKNVSCTDCHFEPGLVNYAKGKLGAMKYLVKHFTQDEFDPQAVVLDTTCLHCHDGLLTDKTLKMDHSMVAEMEASCSDCHKLGHLKTEK